MSKARDRPANARPECGVAWLDMGERGDGAGREDYAVLIMRNMLVSKDFAHAIQRVPRPGEEAATMGPYFPRSGYASRRSFEARGCPAAASPARGPGSTRRPGGSGPQGARSCRSRLRVALPRGARSVSVFAGKRRLARVRVAPGRRSVRIALPRTRATRVRVVVRRASGRSVRWVRRVPRCA